MTPKQPAKAKARVMWATEPMKHEGAEWFKVMSRPDDHIFTNATRLCLVLPMPTLKAARARMRFEGMDREAKVEALAKAIFEHKNPFEHWSKWQKGSVAESCRDYARVCLGVIEGDQVTNLPQITPQNARKRPF